MKTDSDKKIELNELNDIIFHGAPVTITPQQQKAIDDSYDFLAAFSHDKVIYGINTGFGPMAQYRIDNDSLTALQYNIIRSHSTGAGEPLTAPYVKAAMVARLYTFLQGKSGVHRELTDLLVQFINNDIYPYSRAPASPSATSPSSRTTSSCASPARGRPPEATSPRYSTSSGCNPSKCTSARVYRYQTAHR